MSGTQLNLQSPFNTSKDGISLTSGLMNGHLPVNLPTWYDNTPYVRQDSIFFLMSAPGFFRYLPEAAEYYAVLKQYVEVWPTEVTGVTLSLTADRDGAVVGNGGGLMEVTTKVTEAQSEVTFSGEEKRGKPATTLIDTWIRMGLQDPHLKKPGIIAADAYLAANGGNPPPLTQDDKAMTILVIEPTENLQGVMHSVMITNMMPHSNDIELTRVMNGSLERLDYSHTFSGFQWSRGLLPFAQAKLDELNKAGYASAAVAPFYSEIAPELREDSLPMGYRQGVADVARAAGA